MKLFQNNRQCGGFTLVDMLIAISIIIVLSVAGLSTYDQFIMRQRDEQRILDLHQFALQLEQYKTLYGVYPCGDANDSGNAGGMIDGSGSCPANSTQDVPGFLNGGTPATVSNCDVALGPSNGLFSVGIATTNCPKDPLNVEVAGLTKTIYVYQATGDRNKYIVEAYLESNKKRMANDGGTCSDVYEVGPGVGVIIADPFLGLPPTGNPDPCT